MSRYDPYSGEYLDTVCYHPKMSQLLQNTVSIDPSFTSVPCLNLHFRRDLGKSGLLPYRVEKATLLLTLKAYLHKKSVASRHSQYLC